MATESNHDAPRPADVATSESLQEQDEHYHQLPEHPVLDEAPAEDGSSLELPTYNYSQPFSANITRGELACGGIVLVLWLVFFTFGLFVPTSGMRDTLWTGGAETVVKTLGYAVAVGVSFTLTNILFLACFASFLGCMAQRWQVGDGLEKIPSNALSVAATRIYMAALIRGFFLYLMFISGFLLVSNDQTVTGAEFTQYIRIAGMMSIVGFIVGYDPNLLLQLMRRILSLANLPLDDTGAKPAGARQPINIRATPTDRGRSLK